MERFQFEFAVVAACIIILMGTYLYPRRKKKKQPYIHSGFRMVQQSGVDGSPCMIVGDHPFAKQAGNVIGYTEDGDRWGLVIALKDLENVTIYVFESSHLVWTRPTPSTLEEKTNVIANYINQETQDLSDDELFKIFSMLRYRCESALENLEDRQQTVYNEELLKPYH